MNVTELRATARRHLGPHFTRKDTWQSDFPVFVRGEGSYLVDTEGRRHLDGLAGLFCVNMGHGRADIAKAAAEQAGTLAYASNWGSAHPPSIEAARIIADLAPGDLGTTFFVNSGSEAVETALKFVRQYHRSQGAPERTKIISREMAYHGTTMGALSVTGLPKIKEPFGPLLPGIRHVPNTLGFTGDRGPADQLDCVRAIEAVILEEGPETVAAVFAEPVQNGRGALVPPEGYWPALRALCDKYGILLVSDEVICSFGRLGHFFGHGLTGVVPDLITFAKGSTSGYAPLGGVIVREQLVTELYDSPKGGVFTHGATWGGHPVSTAVAVANISAMRDEKVPEHVLAEGPKLHAALESLKDAHRCVKDVRGTGFFYAIELMADRDGGRELTDEESLTVLREVLPESFRRTGVILRGDDRGATMLMVSPPLVAGTDVLDELLHGIDGMLTDVEKAIQP
ncbi:aspartate aminotransferase family protein [Amycolatopsis rubida]|uniref:Adenosylmethionine-8-amino-7-oxononanoate aminotransferase n=1 Tax=Amycolatopsis rubida TaxID=112413 RepID=A0A1I6B8F9_9PSEU|nr:MULTISPECIES: aspartate aminotransferase family protein [Amycolatopsis]MYW93052.1 aspartate aminotransferase family protein [Amycolatopsis rubida]NEC58039.1 aspartate aminotransferase family protein [Amycolatopsis rubida]OAP20966.1 Taurine--pyruvate aminotransferase [Amycolatopsis sp. M39]SFQ77231.1 Adenosylmethionine-8-amino-7-oxononanoate aminotransferase [Amycolatopsis rubida]